MALTLGAWIGFETGDMIEATSTIGSPDATETTIVRTGARSLKMVGAATAAKYFLGVKPAWSGNNIIAGFGVYFTDLTPGTAYNFFSDGAGDIELRLTTGGNAEILDKGGSVVATATTPFTLNTWHFVELHWKRDASAGEAELFVDNSSVVSTGTSEDFGTGGFGNINLSGPGSGDGTVYFDDVYILTGAASAADRYGDFEVFKRQTIKTGTTADAGVLSNATTGFLSGLWEGTANTPLNAGTEIEYDGNGGGSVDTADLAGDFDGDSNIKGIKGIWHLDRDGGGGTTHYVALGDSGDGNSPAATTVALTTTPTTFLSWRTTNLPQKSVPDAVRQGIWVDGAQDIHVFEMWAMIAHVPGVSGSTDFKTINVTFTTTMANTPVKIGVLAANVGFVTAIALTRKLSFFRTINVAFGTAINVIKKTTPVAKAISFITTMVTTPAKMMEKAISVAFGTAFTLSKTTKLAKAVAFVTSMSHSTVKTAFKSIAVGFTTAFAVAKKVSVTKAVAFVTSMELATLFIAGAQTFFKEINVAFVTTINTTAVQLILRTFNVAFVTAMSTTPVPTFVRAFNVTFGTAMSLAKTVKKTIAVAFSTAFSLARKVSVTKTVAFVTTMSLVTALFFTKALSVSFVTGMTLARGLTLSKTINVTFTTAMSLVKKVLKTFTVSFSTGFGLTKLILVTKPMAFVTSMALTTVVTVFVETAVSFVTTMVTSPAAIFIKSMGVGFVTAFATATRFITGLIVPTGAMLLFLRRRRWGRKRR